MARKDMKVGPTVEALKPYLDRALNDKEFRSDLRDALSAAKQLYGPLAKDARDGGAAKSASRLATDAKVQESLRKALEDFGRAAGTLKGRKKSTKSRNAMLLAGLIAGALYNPWSGPQTRNWLMDKVAGDDDLQPLEEFDFGATDSEDAVSTNGAADAETDMAEATEK
ncbi:MAG: hypothetical protein EXQ81_04625 [Thermoleophilia bacterium]|nr:hypothetical protein [Thermoleophilia bacterium]